MNLTGREWKIEDPNRLFLSGVLGGFALTGLWLFYIGVTADLQQRHMMPFLRQVKSQSMYGFWASLLFLVLLALLYGDATAFSGKATEWWAYIGRVGFILTSLINVSVIFWSFWFLTEPGTPSLEFLYKSYWWEWSVERVQKLTYLATPWYASHYLRSEFGLDRVKIYGSLLIPYISLLLLAWFLAKNFQQVAVSISGLFGSIAATAPIFMAVYRDLEGENEPPKATDNGLTQNYFLRPCVLSSLVGFGIGISLGQAFILSRFPIEGGDPLFIFIRYITVFAPLLLLLTLRALRE